MAKSEASVEELVSMIERGELRLPEMQRRYVWRSTRVRDLLDSLYRGYPSGAILLWETDDDVPLQDFSVKQQANPYKSTRLLLDGQQRLTSLSSVIRGEPVTVRGRKKPIDILFNLDHPDQLTGRPISTMTTTKMTTKMKSRMMPSRTKPTHRKMSCNNASTGRPSSWPPGNSSSFRSG